MKKTFIRAAVMAAIFAAAPALAHEYKLGQIEIDHPYSRAMLPGAAVGGGYLKIVNHGEADRLLRVTTSRAKSTQLHEMQMGDDVMTMREMTDGLEIPAHGVLELKPGAFHVMFMNVAEPFKEGERVKATLTFEKAGSVDVDFVVGAPAGAPPPMPSMRAAMTIWRISMPRRMRTPIMITPPIICRPPPAIPRRISPRS
ncbi:copper chaperone PCu(A)C [Rhizobium sp. G21]|uniref:copper chaperone PCu(A)C n=1 Tax=Rhizobium sp. G21 TaxID=2758439 RepID=UPI0015FFC9B0|nr:copper chaperone PCu(A)C [Rhizobium sp. G21]MBB1251086.1 copper chaperone PCu(A)C [Rhizobium sp. G21]